MTLAESAAVVGELRRARRKRRVASIHWIDALYQVYLTGIVSVVVVVVLSGAIGDGKVSPAGIADIKQYGPAAAGLLVSLAVFMGLRSGSRGGPLALERPDVRHVLLSPVDRGVALRGPAWRQLRFLVAIAAAVGAATGQLLVRRLPGNPLEWIVCGALFCVTAVGLGYGSALLASGLKMKHWMASLVGGVLVAWSAGDLVGRVPLSPATVVGHIAVWPLEPDWFAVLGVILAVILVVLGMRWVSGISLEAAERRTALVGQMRFAVTLQDLRTVLVLRRQLSQEHPRSKPWIRAARRTPKYPVWHRGVRSVARWPLSRVVRAVLMAAIAGMCLRAVWNGTTPLVILAGMALWVAALDAAEPLGQEIDHPGRTDTFPMPRGQLFLLHLPILLVVSVIVGVIAGAIAVAPIGASVPVGPGLFTGFMAGLLAACGGAISVVQGAPDPVDTLSMVTPEIAGTRTVFRTALPPAMAVLGTMPLLAARASFNGSQKPPPMAAAMNIAILLSIIIVIVGGWVRFRDDIKKWMADAADQMSPTKAVERQREERLADELREREALKESRRVGEEASPAQRAKARQPRPKPKPSTPVSPPPEGVRGGTSAKPIGRKRDQK
ncbi:hypothetical protein [Aquihabitans sp. McL0605]|uniref:hypothetical protein n=1 Tax=Aquihabitans sp. McL0605 TaxID=3415671 RepID=UPI003CE92B6D